MGHLSRTLILAVAVFQGVANGAANVTAIITEDSYFYGQSPPVYPSREFLTQICDTTDNFQLNSQAAHLGLQHMQKRSHWCLR
jgi:hypothetical protein